MMHLAQPALLFLYALIGWFARIGWVDFKAWRARQPRPRDPVTGRFKRRAF